MAGQTRLPVDVFRTECLGPAHVRAEELAVELREAELTLDSLLRSRHFDEVAALNAQLRLEETRRAHHRWERRWRFMEGVANTCDAADFVTFEETFS